MREPADPHLKFVLYNSLIMGTHHLPTVARRSGLSYDLLLKLCNGERNVLAKHIPAIYRGTQDLDLFAELAGARDCGLLVSERGEASKTFRAPVSITLAIASAAGRVAQLVADAEGDKKIDETEAKAILSGLEALERKVVALRRSVNADRETA